MDIKQSGIPPNESAVRQNLEGSLGRAVAVADLSSLPEPSDTRIPPAPLGEQVEFQVRTALDLSALVSDMLGVIKAGSLLSEDHVDSWNLRYLKAGHRSDEGGHDFRLHAWMNHGSDTVGCDVKNTDLDYEKQMDCMVKLRDHLTHRIQAAAQECPMSPENSMDPVPADFIVSEKPAAWVPSASEALFGFMGWLTTRYETLLIGSTHECSPVPELIDQFTKTNQLDDPRDGWENHLEHPLEASGRTDAFGREGEESS